MKNKLEHILLSILLGLSVFLGLSFWLNTVFSFNIFCGDHWDELSKLQASQTPVNMGFYASFAIAIFIFAFGIYMIYRYEIRHIKIIKNNNTNTTPKQIIPTPTQSEETKVIEITEPVISVSRPPRLNLPKNMAQIAEQKNTARNETIKKDSPSINPYNQIISDIFSASGYIVKQNPVISGFTPNLFAIGNNEIVWVGGVDCDIEKMVSGLQKLDSVFKETLEDIPININGFILDTMNKYDSNNNALMIFKSIDELKEFIKAHPADAITENDQDSFDSYSEYIDTIIQYIKNI